VGAEEPFYPGKPAKTALAKLFTMRGARGKVKRKWSPRKNAFGDSRAGRGSRKNGHLPFVLCCGKWLGYAAFGFFADALG